MCFFRFRVPIIAVHLKMLLRRNMVWRSVWRKQRSCVLYISWKGKSKVCLLIDDQQELNQFEYLVSWISHDGYATKDMSKNCNGQDIVHGQEVVNREIELWAKEVNYKEHSLECNIVCSSDWTLTKASEKLLEAFEMWMWQRMVKIIWTEKVTNEEVLVRANEARSILKTIWYRKHRWLGHVLRHDNLPHDIIEGKMLGKATYGVGKGWSYCMI